MNQPPVWEGSNKAPFFFGNNKRRYIISLQKLISSKYLKFWLSYEWFSDLCNILLPKQNQPFLSEKVVASDDTCHHMQSSKTMHLFPSSSFLYQISSQYLHFHASSFTITFLIRVISGDIDLSLFSLCFWRASHDMLLKHIGRSIIPQVWQFRHHNHSSSLKVLLWLI